MVFILKKLKVIKMLDEAIQHRIRIKEMFCWDPHKLRFPGLINTLSAYWKTSEVTGNC